MSKGTYERRKANNECVFCGKPNDNEAVFCLDCKAKRKTYAKDWRKAYIDLGICTQCRTEQAMAGQRLCYECAKKHRERSVEYDNRHKKERSERYAAYTKKKHEQGLCRCGRKAENGKKMCGICLYKARKRQEEYRMSKGIIPRSIRVSLGYCYQCGNELDRKGSVCKKCYATKVVPEPVPNEYWRKDNRLISYHIAQ